MGLKEPGLRGSLRNVSVKIPPIPDSEVLDDWADGQLTSERDDFETTPYQFESDDDEKFVPTGTRPEWNIEAGNPTVSGNNLIVDDSTVLSIDLDNISNESKVWEFRAKTTTSSGAINFLFWYQDSGNFCRVQLANVDRIVLDIFENGSRVVEIIADIDPSTERLVRVERDTAGDTTWTLIIDGEVQGSEQTDFEPETIEQRIDNSGDGEGEVNSYSRFELVD